MFLLGVGRPCGMTTEKRAGAIRSGWYIKLTNLRDRRYPIYEDVELGQSLPGSSYPS